MADLLEGRWTTVSGIPLLQYFAYHVKELLLGWPEAVSRLDDKCCSGVVSQEVLNAIKLSRIIFACACWTQCGHFKCKLRRTPMLFAFAQHLLCLFALLS